MQRDPGRYVRLWLESGQHERVAQVLAGKIDAWHSTRSGARKIDAWQSGGGRGGTFRCTRRCCARRRGTLLATVRDVLVALVSSGGF